jgi:hypothetical protein
VAKKAITTVLEISKENDEVRTVARAFLNNSKKLLILSSRIKF